MDGKPNPFDADALGALYDEGRALEDAGDLAGAAKAFLGCLKIDPDDHCGVALRLAKFGKAAPTAAPPAYVATLFDQTADAFDDILVRQLGYDVPRLARTLAGGHIAGPHRMLDLGCGTGLAGVAFADLAPDIIGVDLAQDMLSHAHDRGVYGDLYVGEAVAFMQTWDEAPFSLIVATDVWPYIGNLAPFLDASRTALTPDGWLIASSERTQTHWTVTNTQRFAHAPSYVTTALAKAGFALVDSVPIVVRTEEGVPVAGDLFLARLGARP